MKKLKVIKPVYTYYFPQIRKLIDGIVKKYPHEIFLKSTKPGLDNFHLPVIQNFLKFYKDYLTGLDKFPFRYPVSGSSEGIFHLLVWLKNNYPDLPVYVLKGEYEGYGEYGKNIGVAITEVTEKELLKARKGILFVSNPSARDGNIIENEFINQCADHGHKLIADMAYLGLTRKYNFNLSHPNIIAVLTSLSKPFGLFYYRIGFVFTRFEMPTLYPNIWFKNILSLIIADKIFTKFKPDYFYNKYRSLQEKILARIKSETGIQMRKSDVIFLGYLTNGDFEKLDSRQQRIVEPFCRSKKYRFCLTPYFMKSNRCLPGV